MYYLALSLRVVEWVHGLAEWMSRSVGESGCFIKWMGRPTKRAGRPAKPMRSAIIHPYAGGPGAKRGT